MEVRATLFLKAPMLASPKQPCNLTPEPQDSFLCSGLYLYEANSIALLCTWMDAQT